MDKSLPKVFANPINKAISNNEEVYYSNNKKSKSELRKENIPEKINRIFADPHHVYKSKVKITTSDSVFDSVIVGRKGDNLLTIKGERININSIENIEKY